MAETAGTALTYLNDAEARTVEVITERIIPGDASAAGAAEAGVVYYIDRAITGFSTRLQGVYRRGLRELDALCRQRYQAPFIDLPAAEQDRVVGELLGPSVAVGDGNDDPAPDTGGADIPLLRRLFAVIREHTIEGYFCDPVYGGNRNAAGWRLVGFPGAQWGYTAGQMKPGFDATTIPIKTLADLRAELRTAENGPRSRPGAEE